MRNSPAYLRTKKMTKEEKRMARGVEEKKRRAAEREREMREAEEMAEVEFGPPNGDGRRHHDQYLEKKRAKEQKNIARDLEERRRRDLEDNYLRSEREEKRRLRIAELALAKV